MNVTQVEKVKQNVCRGKRVSRMMCFGKVRKGSEAWVVF